MEKVFHLLTIVVIVTITTATATTTALPHLPPTSFPSDSILLFVPKQRIPALRRLPHRLRVFVLHCSSRVIRCVFSAALSLAVCCWNCLWLQGFITFHYSSRCSLQYIKNSSSLNLWGCGILALTAVCTSPFTSCFHRCYCDLQRHSLCVSYSFMAALKLRVGAVVQALPWIMNLILKEFSEFPSESSFSYSSAAECHRVQS